MQSSTKKSFLLSLIIVSLACPTPSFPAQKDTTFVTLEKWWNRNFKEIHAGVPLLIGCIAGLYAGATMVSAATLGCIYMMLFFRGDDDTSVKR